MQFQQFQNIRELFILIETIYYNEISKKSFDSLSMKNKKYLILKDIHISITNIWDSYINKYKNGYIWI